MEPPTPEKARCEKCGDQGETWAFDGRVLCTDEARLAVAEMTLQGFSDVKDIPTLIMARDILGASLEAAEDRLMALTGGKWSGSQK